MPTTTFASVVLYVPKDAKAVLDFYVKAFDLKMRHYDPAFDFGELDTGTTSIAVAAHSAGRFMAGDKYAPTEDGYPKNVELAFLTKDVDAAYQRAVESGCTPLCSPKVMPWGQSVAYVRSIEGTLVGLLSPIVTS